MLAMILVVVLFAGAGVGTAFYLFGSGKGSLTELSSQKSPTPIESPKPTKTTDPGFYLLPPGERGAIEQKEWTSEWDSEFKELDREGNKTFYGLTTEEESEYLKIVQEIDYSLVRIKHVKDVKHWDYDLDPEVNVMYDLAGNMRRNIVRWHQKVLEDVRFRDLDNTDEIPTAYRMCGCVRCYKRLIDYLQGYEALHSAKLTERGIERYSPKNRKSLPGYNAIKYQDPKDKGVQHGKKTQKAIEAYHDLYPYSMIKTGGLIADKITTGSITADTIRVTPLDKDGSFKKETKKSPNRFRGIGVVDYVVPVPPRREELPDIRAVANALLNRRASMVPKESGPLSETAKNLALTKIILDPESTKKFFNKMSGPVETSRNTCTTSWDPDGDPII